jgi:hypothetical protein
VDDHPPIVTAAGAARAVEARLLRFGTLPVAYCSRRLRRSSAAALNSSACRTLVFRSFLVLSLVRGSRGHAGDEWFVDLGG